MAVVVVWELAEHEIVPGTGCPTCGAPLEPGQRVVAALEQPAAHEECARANEGV
jgi:predicted nucleic acid-binding Zn ribbon protein